MPRPYVLHERYDLLLRHLRLELFREVRPQLRLPAAYIVRLLLHRVRVVERRPRCHPIDAGVDTVLTPLLFRPHAAQHAHEPVRVERLQLLRTP